MNSVTLMWLCISLGILCLLLFILYANARTSLRSMKYSKEIYQGIAEEKSEQYYQALEDNNKLRHQVYQYEARDAEKLNDTEMEYIHDSLRRAADGDPST